MFSIFKPKNASYKLSNDNKSLVIKDSVKSKFVITVLLMLVSSFNLWFFTREFGIYFNAFALFVSLIAIIHTYFMFTTQVTDSIIKINTIEYLFYRNTGRVQQTSIKLKNGKYRNVIFETEANRNDFVFFAREVGIEVKVVESRLPLLPLNY